MDLTYPMSLGCLSWEFWENCLCYSETQIFINEVIQVTFQLIPAKVICWMCWETLCVSHYHSGGLSQEALVSVSGVLEDIKAWTKWLTFCRWHLKMHCFEYQSSSFDTMITEVCYLLFLISLTADKRVAEPVLTKMSEVIWWHYCEQNTTS